jgi:hypothetical protein
MSSKPPFLDYESLVGKSGSKPTEDLSLTRKGLHKEASEEDFKPSRKTIDETPALDIESAPEVRPGERTSDGDWASLGSRERLHAFQQETAENLRSDQESPDSKPPLVSIPAVKVSGPSKSHVR